MEEASHAGIRGIGCYLDTRAGALAPPSYPPHRPLQFSRSGSGRRGERASEGWKKLLLTPASRV